MSGGALRPSWICIGPRIGYNSLVDADALAQTDAMKALAYSRGDAFFDNRSWALPVADVVTRGYLQAGDGYTHYTLLAQHQWVPKMINEMGLNRFLNYSPANPTSIDIIFGGTFRGGRDGYSSGVNNSTEHMGSLRIATPPGAGASSLIVEDSAGAVNTNDWFGISYTSNVASLALGAVNYWSTNTGIGRGAIWYGSTASTSTPNGLIGGHSTPLSEVVTSAISVGYVEKSADYTTVDNDSTVCVTSGSPTITLKASAASNKGRIYRILNNGAGTVTIATTSSQTINGAAPGTILAGGRLTVQSTGGGWVSL